MLREEVEQVKTMIDGAYIPLQQQVNATFDDLKKEIAALKKEVAELKKKSEKTVGIPAKK